MPQTRVKQTARTDVVSRRAAGLRAGGERREARQHHAEPRLRGHLLRGHAAQRDRARPRARPRGRALESARRCWPPCAPRAAPPAPTPTSASRCCSRRSRARRSTGRPLRERLGDVLRALTVEDARAAYAAIRLAGAGGLDEPVEHDVRDEPRVTLREAMAAAAQRDTIASEYVSDSCGDLRARAAGPRRCAGRRAARARRDRRVGPAPPRRRAGHADRAQARRRGGRSRGGRRSARCSAPAVCAVPEAGRRWPSSMARCAGTATRSTRGPRPIS